jgi:hypothetical protein
VAAREGALAGAGWANQYHQGQLRNGDRHRYCILSQQLSRIIGAG